MKSRVFPPLGVWVLTALLLVCILVVSSMKMDYQNPKIGGRQWRHFQESADSLEAKWPFDSAAYKVVIWGSSLTCQAVRHRPYFEAALADVCSGNITVQKLYMLSANINDLPDLKQLFALTKRIQPDLLLIEDHLFLYRVDLPNTSDPSVLVRLATDNWLGIGKKPFHQGRLMKKADFDSYHQRLSSKSVDSTKAPEIDRFIINYSQQERLRERLAEYELSALPMVILNVPRPRPVQQRNSTPVNVKETERLLRKYHKAGYAIDYWEYPEAMPFTHYSDFAHMNESGRNLYSTWLTDRLTTYFDEQCSSSN